MDPNDPFADLIPASGSSAGPAPRVGYIPGVPKAPSIPSGYEPDPSRPGALHPIPGGPADKPDKTDDPKVTEGERTAAFLTTRLVGALGRIGQATKADPSAAKPPILPTVVRGIFGDTAGNYLTDSDRQQVEAAQLDAVDAALTLGTGAAYTPDQLQSYRKAYFPQLGDSAATIASKRQAFQTLIESAKLKAGASADKIDQALAAAGVPPMGDSRPSVGGFGLKQQGNELSPDQQAQEQAFLATNPSVKDYAAFLAKLQGGGTVDPGGAAARLKALQSGAGYNPEIGQDPRVQKLIDQQMQQGGGAGAAALAGVADTAGLGFADEFGAGVNALGQSLSGNGSFGDNFNVDLQANRGYQQALQQANPLSYLGGQIGGGALLPVGEVSAPIDLAKAGAAYGGAYGAGSGEDIGGRLGGGATGAAAGGALGYALPRLGQMLSRSPSEVPPMVDPATGALNQPLEAMRPGQRVAAAQQFGIDLPMDAAGGRTAAIIGKGLDIMPGSAGVMEDARRATEEQVANAADRVAGRFGASRTLNEAGAELQRGAGERIDRGKAIIAKAYNAIPISGETPAANSNTVATLQQLTGRFQSNPELAEVLRDPRLASYLGAIQKGGLSWKDLKDFRSLIGEKIGDMRFGEGHSTSDLRALYAGLSEDMRSTAAAQGPRALQMFQRANNLNRENEQLIQGALTRILGKDGQMRPEQAAAAVQAMTKGGKSTGDIKALAQIRAATIKSGAWDEVASTLIRLGGQPANSQGRDFNPQTFTNWYADMSEPARNLLFGKTELRKALDQFVAVNQRLTKVNALRNTSQTAGSMMAAGTVGVLGLGAIHPTAALGLIAEMGGNLAMAKAWTNPGFVRWATGFAKVSNTNAAKAQIGRLSKLAATNPELRQPLVALQQKLLSAVNDNSMMGAAASGPNPEEQQ